MESIRVCIGNLWALQERRYEVVYVAVTKFVRTMLRLILLTTPRYFWYIIPLFSSRVASVLPSASSLSVLPLPPMVAHLFMASKPRSFNRSALQIRVFLGSLYGGSTKPYKLAPQAARISYFLLPSFRRSWIYRDLTSVPAPNFWF
ncbi:hypothetical protein KC19_7G034800 [Ceratodon purpureus]|uniref:Uncharacterized protein n=1 Tax=Ceratodon purpureus TaxID=3225 RepID=A0A8T0H5K1_CERPU|nr:hypothetical protein KC19_7G034800 [Ceratodon purpureus]